jgi:hypothetical protein
MIKTAKYIIFSFLFISLFVIVIALVDIENVYGSDSTSFHDNLLGVVSRTDDVAFIGIVPNGSWIAKPGCPWPSSPRIFGASVSGYTEFFVGYPFGGTAASATGVAAYAFDRGWAWSVHIHHYGIGRGPYGGSIKVITSCR